MLFDYLGERQTTTTKFERTNFLHFDLGQHLVRILGIPKMHYVNYVPSAKPVTVKCLEDDCPFCKINKNLILEYPKDFKNQKGWNPRQERHYLNVLDRTPVKVCPQCGVENKKTVGGSFSPACRECSTIISAVETTLSNKVKVANINYTNAGQLKEYEKTTLDSDGNLIGLHNFDIMFLVTKPGEKKNIVPIPVPQSNDKIEVPEESLYDLDKVIIELSAEEMLELQRGISLKDIFSARREPVELTSDAEDTQELEEVVEQKVKDIEKRISEIFG